jgi:5-methylcytosine-specific restriction endonuclease McrA
MRKKPQAEIDAIIQKIAMYKEQGLNQTEVGAKLGYCQTYISQLSSKHGNFYWFNRRDQWGPKNSSYKNGMSKSTIWRLTKRIVLESGRDLYTCERCGLVRTDMELPRHHKDYNRANNDPSNIEVLCHGCHNREHNVHRKRNEDGTWI